MTHTDSARLTAPDWLRSFALIAVMAQHILGAYARRDGVGQLEMAGISVCFELVRFGVPLFVALFGMMLARSSERPFQPVRYYRRRIWQLVVPYLLWSAFYFLASGGKTHLRDFPAALVSGSAAYHLWYVPMILQFVLLAPVFVWLLRRLDGGRRPWLGWCGLFAVSFAWLGLLALFQGHAGVLGVLVRRQTALFVSWMVYFSAGAFCGRHYEAFCRWTRRAWPVCLALVAVGLGLLIPADLRANTAAGHVQFNVVGLQQIPCALLLLCEFVCLHRLAMALGHRPRLSRAAAFGGQHSYRAYLAHVECINLLNARLVAHIACLPVYYALLLLLTIFSSLAAAWVLDAAAGWVAARRPVRNARRSD